MPTRRDVLGIGLAAGALALGPGWLRASNAAAPLITRTLPSSGAVLPAIGLGTSASFSRLAGEGDTAALKDVLTTLLDGGARVIDTAPSYGEAERVAGELIAATGRGNEVFWATKLNVAPRGGGSADPAAARAQLDTSLRRLGKQPLDLVQVHNLGDLPVQLEILKEAKAAGRVRHIGVTTTLPQQYPQLIETMRREPLDCIGVDYAIDNRTMEDTVLPLAAERGIGVLVYAPFGRTRLWEKVRGQPPPDWAAEFDAYSWGQFFLKFVLAHPAVTVVTPATSRATHMLDNLGAGRGRLPDATQRQRMIDHIAAL
jgi:aryl-alcohol dehydrogenase-like predicted oxidoreductase